MLNDLTTDDMEPERDVISHLDDEIPNTYVILILL